MENNDYKFGFDVQEHTLAASSELEIWLLSNYVRCFESNIPFELAIGDKGLSEFKQGRFYETPTPFEKVRIKNTSSSGTLTVKLGFAYGKLGDDSFTVSGGDPISTKSGNTLVNANVTVGSASAVLLATANTSRTNIIIQNLDTVNNLYVGASGVTVSNAPKILPNGTIELRTGAAIYGVADGTNTDVRVIEERT